ncbi:MAG: hypothetical protein V2B13_11080, partial [Pseudomonadota bacterium]
GPLVTADPNTILIVNRYSNCSSPNQSFGSNISLRRLRKNEATNSNSNIKKSNIQHLRLVEKQKIFIGHLFSSQCQNADDPKSNKYADEDPD